MIVVKSLAKSFGAIRAVDEISFSVGKGEILGFLGPNGAGKSTTMKMLTTFLPPTSGTASLETFDILENPLEVRSRIGYLPEAAPSYRDMCVYDFLKFAAEVRGYDGDERHTRVVRMLESCNLKDVAWQLIDTLSKGYRQRVGFAQALLHDPDYLILDEPTDGLDPNQKQEVRALIRRMGREKCIILSTHILEEVEAVCSRAIIIGAGRIVADGTPESLKSQSALHGAITLELSGIGLPQAIEELQLIDGVTSVSEVIDDRSMIPLEADQDSEATAPEKTRREKDLIRVRLFPQKGVAIAQETAKFIHQRNWKVVVFTQEKGDLNEVFYKLTKGGEHS